MQDTQTILRMSQEIIQENMTSSDESEQDDRS